MSNFDVESKGHSDHQSEEFNQVQSQNRVNIPHKIEEEIDEVAQDGHAVHFQGGHALVGQDSAAERKLRWKVNLFILLSMNY